MVSISMQRKRARQIFLTSYRKFNFCNWCGNIIDEMLLVHHGDGDPTNNNPHNLWALCGRACHWNVHDVLSISDGTIRIRVLGGITAAGAGAKKYHRENKGTLEYSERQRKAAQAGVGESKAKGARVANSKRVKCPDCDRIMNPGSLGMHKRIHRNGD